MTTRRTLPNTESQNGDPSQTSNTELPWWTMGVVELGPETLTESCSEQIDLDLKGRSVEISDRDAFYKALDLAIACFHAGRNVRGFSRPAAVRKSLKKIFDSVHKFGDNLESLNLTARGILDESADGGLEAHFTRVRKVIAAHKRALKVVDDHPISGGNLKDWDRIHLAVAVADAIETYSNVTATTTKDGLYMSLLEMVLADALRQEVKAVHGLAGKALKYRAEQNHPDDSLEDGSATPNK